MVKSTPGSLGRGTSIACPAALLSASTSELKSLLKNSSFGGCSSLAGALYSLFGGFRSLFVTSAGSGPRFGSSEFTTETIS